MIKATLDRQLMIHVSDSVGSLAEVTSVVSSSEINMLALCAYALGGNVSIMFVTEDNNAAKQLLEEKGYTVEEEEVVLLSLENKPGALQRVTDKISEAKIDLTLMYGSVDREAEFSPIVLISKNNLDVITLIRTELERS